MIQFGGGGDRNRAIHDALSKTAQEINNHAEIVSILEEIVTDIETAHTLELQLYQERLQADLQERYQWATEALEEYKAMEKEKEYTSQKVGELFLRDLMLLEDKLEAMTSIVPCQNMTDNSSHVDPVSSNDLQQTFSSPPPAAPLPPQEGIISNVDIVQESKETSRDESLPLTDSNNELATSMMEQPNEQNQKDENDNDDKKDIQQIQQPVEIDEMIANARNAGQIPESTRLQAGVLPKKNKITPNLQYLKSGLLMKIFEYMDAIDIVNMAQANVSLYTKINNIFGLGGTIVAGSRYVDDDDIDENYQSDEEDLPPVVVIDNNDEEEAQQQEQNNPQHESTSRDSVKSSSDGQKATIVAIPVAKSSSSVAAKHDSTRSVNLPPDTTTKTLRSVDAKANIATSKPRTTTTTTPPPAAAGFQMSASVAQSLASKLLPAELSAIIAMRDQLRKKEEDLQRAQEDVSDLTAQLEGTISVKEVLASKLKDLQKKVESDEEISAKMTRQVASDQEVIAFLDERVQELEKAVDNFHMERTKANKAIDKVKDASERQVAVLSDMLTYEREQRADQEKEWKSTKKVLIKEVKLCRAQIMALEAERDGFREENQRLKEALMALGAGAKAGRSFDTIMS